MRQPRLKHSLLSAPTRRPRKRRVLRAGSSRICRQRRTSPAHQSARALWQSSQNQSLRHTSRCAQPPLALGLPPDHQYSKLLSAFESRKDMSRLALHCCKNAATAASLRECKLESDLGQALLLLQRAFKRGA